MGNSNTDTDTDTDIFYRNCNYSTATAGNNSHKFTQLESRVSQLKLKQFKDVRVALPDTRQNEIPDRDGSRVIYYPRVSGRVHTTRSALVTGLLAKILQFYLRDRAVSQHPTVLFT